MKKTILFLFMLFLPLFAMSNVTDLSTLNQVKTEFAKPGPVVLLYYTDWCPACKAFEPTYEQLSNDAKDVRFYKMNCDKLTISEHVNQFGYIPTVYVGKDANTLRKTPCQIAQKDRRIEYIKKELEKCLAK